MRRQYELKEIDHLIRRVGGTNAVARRFGISQNAVSNWKRRGFPPQTYAAWQQILKEAGLSASPELWRQRHTVP